MIRFLLVFGAIFGFIQCGGSEPVETAGQEPDPGPFLGRWDVTATQGEETFPLWFELEMENGALQGRFQPRGGHSRPLDEVSIHGGSHLELTCCDFKLQGQASGAGLEGTGESGGDSFSWRAARAPELPPAADLKWGEPVDLLARGLEGWKVLPGGGDPESWSFADGVLNNSGRGVNIRTVDDFRDFKLHLEVNCPEGSNSGIYLRGRYEIQVQDDYGKPPHNRRMGGVYGAVTPSSNAARPAGEWQEMDVTLTGRWVTVVLNGKTIIDHQEIPGITGGALDSRESEPGPIYLQGDHGSVSYRNIILTPALGGGEW